MLLPSERPESKLLLQLFFRVSHLSYCQLKYLVSLGPCMSFMLYLLAQTWVSHPRSSSSSRLCCCGFACFFKLPCSYICNKSFWSNMISIFTWESIYIGLSSSPVSSNCINAVSLQKRTIRMTMYISPKALFNYINYTSVHSSGLGFTQVSSLFCKGRNKGVENFTDLHKQLPTERH